MKLYQIIKHEGLGVVECPTVSSAVEGEVYSDKKKAEKRADELWKKYTTESDRKSGWCPLYYSVKEINTK